MTVFVDPDLPAPLPRQRIYDGNPVVLTAVPSVRRHVDRTREQLIDLFSPYDPEHAHEHIDPEEMAKVLGTWKPRLIHSTRSKDLVCQVIREVGFSSERTHFDVPKPRTSFPTDHLTTGIAFAFPWHRDVWYGAPAQQINWWLPVLAVREDNSMGFDPQSFDRAVKNSSREFDYSQNNNARLNTATQISGERQVRPAALDHKPGRRAHRGSVAGCHHAVLGAPLHASIPNRSGRARFSVDFRTVDVADLNAGRGAPRVDDHCTGTAIRDFRRVSDGAPFSEDALTRLFGAPPPGLALFFAPRKMDGLRV